MKLTKKSNLLLAMIAFFGWISAAQALLYVEPYAAYRLGTQTQTQSGFEYEWASKGTALGARLGTSIIPLITMGVQYEMGSRDESLDVGPTGTTTGDTGDEFDDTHLGIFAAFTSLPLINVWGTYFLSSKLEYSASNTASNVGSSFNGSGYGVGAGFTGLPFLSLNVDYRMFSYDELETAAGVTSTLTNSVDVSEIMISVSSPWDF